MQSNQYNLLLADDDFDDCIFFREALEEIPFPSSLEIVNDGAELMKALIKKEVRLPDILFLDLNMPRKTGFECLLEIKRNKDFQHLPVIIFSTSLDPGVVNALYENGAHYYIRKPGEFSKLKQLIQKAITLISITDQSQPGKENFVLNTG
jgi:CheY-like chemotaxis protein